jgi:hypothetical protein
MQLHHDPIVTTPREHLFTKVGDLRHIGKLARERFKIWAVTVGPGCHGRCVGLENVHVWERVGETIGQSRVSPSQTASFISAKLVSDFLAPLDKEFGECRPLALSCLIKGITEARLRKAKGNIGPETLKTILQTLKSDRRTKEQINRHQFTTS